MTAKYDSTQQDGRLAELPMYTNMRMNEMDFKNSTT